MLGILLFAEPCKACRVFCGTRHTYKHSILPAWCLQLSKTQNAKTVLVRLAIPINTHQNANQKPNGSVPAYRAQCTRPSHPIYQTLLFDFLRVWFRDYSRHLNNTAGFGFILPTLISLTLILPTGLRMPKMVKSG